MPTLLLFVVTSNQLVIVFVPQSTNMAFVVVFGLFVFSFNEMVCSKSRGMAKMSIFHLVWSLFNNFQSVFVALNRSTFNGKNLHVKHDIIAIKISFQL